MRVVQDQRKVCEGLGRAKRALKWRADIGLKHSARNLWFTSRGPSGF